MQMPGMAPQLNIGPPMVPLRVQPQNALNLRQGQVLDGQVLGRQGSQMTLRLGNNVLQTEGSLPLDVGMKFQFQIKGEGSQGTLNLQLLRAQSFSPMTEDDLMQTMTGMKLPVSEKNISLSRSMIEHGVPLTKENFTELKEALAQLPRSTPGDMQSASFLKLSSLPMTPQNITTLSQFITAHPLIGAQLFETQSEFRKLTGSSSRKMSRETMDMLSSVPGLLGEFILDGRKNTKKQNSRAPRNMARQVGIEMPGYGSRDEDDDLLKMLATLRRRISQELEGEEGAEKTLQLLSRIEENMTAQQLINGAKKHDEMSYYYMQVPMRLDDRELTAEIKIYYTTDYEGRKKVDEENAVIELSLSAEYLGTLCFHVEVDHGIIHVDVGVERDEIKAFVERYMPALMENLSRHACAAGNSACYIRQGGSEPSLPMCIQEFETLERVNMSF